MPPCLYASLAQLVEHATVNRGVVGSIPTKLWRAKQPKGLRVRSYLAVMTFAQARKPSSIEYNAGNRLE